MLNRSFAVHRNDFAAFQFSLFDKFELFAQTHESEVSKRQELRTHHKPTFGVISVRADRGGSNCIEVTNG